MSVHVEKVDVLGQNKYISVSYIAYFRGGGRRGAIKGEARRRNKTTTTTTMMMKKKKRTKKRENTDPCDDPYRTSMWSTAVGRVYWWSRWVRMVMIVDQGSYRTASPIWGSASR